MSLTHVSPSVKESADVPRGSGFPGRHTGATALVLGSLVWLAGLVLRYLAMRSAGFTPAQLTWFGQQPFPAPGQLATYQASPALTTAGYGCFAAGAILLCFAFVTFAQVVAVRSPKLALAGGLLVVVGLFSRLYWAGVDHTAFQLIEPLGLDRATQLVLDAYTDISYGPLRVPITAAFGLYFGTLLLSIGAFRAGTFGMGRTLLFLASGTLWTGALKESGALDIVLGGLLCVVFVPLGVRVFRGGEPGAAVSERGPLRIMSW
ncbi:hypothetical protein ACFYVL_08090 [Streptomyces sp. NPDC004111]|uniref:hypothetical protein n=1 Tax=Streptomyces sp. NPDC004111 TaxID=3364690 RepID=UPI0036B0C721